MKAKKSQLASGPPSLTIQIPYQGVFSHVQQWNLRIFKLERQMAGGKYFTRGISEFNKVVPKEELILEAYCFLWIG